MGKTPKEIKDVESGVPEIGDIVHVSLATNQSKGIFIDNIGRLDSDVAKLSADNTFAGDVIVQARLQTQLSSEITPADTDIELPTDGNVFIVTAGINHIRRIESDGWLSGSVVIILARDNITLIPDAVDVGTNIHLELAGDVPFNMESGDTLTLLLDSNNSSWEETSRTTVSGEITSTTIKATQNYEFSDGSTQEYGTVPFPFGGDITKSIINQNKDISATDDNPFSIFSFWFFTS